MSNYKVTLWGTRGSFVQTTLDKMKYGLETSCISLETEDEIFLIDCGSGIRGFDKYIYENNLTYKKINIFLTHYHHDHIFGLGYVNFIYDPTIDIEIFGLGDVYDILKSYFGSPYFPVNIMDLPNIRTTEVYGFQSFRFEDIEVQTTLLQHPQFCIGYKFVTKEKSVAIIFDYEHRVDARQEIVEEFINGCDYLIIDAFSTEEDYHEGWGHNSIDDVIGLVDKLKVGQCLLTHHNINYNDQKIDEIQSQINKTHKNITFAKDYSTFEV